VILVDANLLVYAHDRQAPEHARAAAWFAQVMNGPHRVGLPWPSLVAFCRLVSNASVVRAAVSPAAAWSRVVGWLAVEQVWIPQPGDRHAEILGELLADPSLTSRLVPDAHLAALAIEHGLTLCSTDGDFGRFPGVSWLNPLAAPR
jgi:toxin-antitoxin system PIN domain toxin